MSFLNLEYHSIIFEDASVTQPKLRSGGDIERAQSGISISRPKVDSADLEPGDSATLISTTRALAQDGTTQYSLGRPLALLDTIRLSWTGTGTNPVFRTKRALGIDATTAVTMTRIAPGTVRITATAGTPINTAGVQVGDFLKFERDTDIFTSVFSATNKGTTWKIQSVATGVIDFLDNGSAALDSALVLGATFDMQMRVFSVGPVKIGDTVALGAALNTGNQGAFKIMDVSPDYLEFVNPFAVAQTFLQNSNVVVYDRLIGFLLMRAPCQFAVAINGGAPVTCLALGGEAIHLSTASAYRVDVSNPGTTPVTVTVQYASPFC